MKNLWAAPPACGKRPMSYILTYILTFYLTSYLTYILTYDLTSSPTVYLTLYCIWHSINHSISVFVAFYLAFLCGRGEEWYKMRNIKSCNVSKAKINHPYVHGLCMFTICLYMLYIYTIVYDIHIHPILVKIGDGLLGNRHFSKLSLSTPGSGEASTDIWLPSSDLWSGSCEAGNWSNLRKDSWVACQNS